MIVLVATRLEERAARRELNGSNLRVVRAGVGRGGEFAEAVISCGLAGGVRRGVPSGTVVIPDEIARPNGERVGCDPELSARLRDAARTLGKEPLNAPLATCTTLVTGAERAVFSAHGFAAVDMETGAVFGPRLAAVRVLLDTPERELSDAWLDPLTVLFRPHAWLELPWLARTAPRYARLAARIIRSALSAPFVVPSEVEGRR